jgi:hypothetical protein
MLEKINNKTGKIVVANKDKPNTSSTVGNNEKVIQGKSAQDRDDSNLHALDYNVIEYMKKIKVNIFMFDIFSLPQQRELLHDSFKPHETQAETIIVVEILASGNDTPEIHKVDIESSINATRIGAFSKSQVPHFLLTYKNFNFNVHNCLSYFCASSNIMPSYVFQKINGVPQINKKMGLFS